MNDSYFIPGVIVGSVIGVLFASLLVMHYASDLTYRDVMRQAYERGHAVRCLGQEGYYWECEE